MQGSMMAMASHQGGMHCNMTPNAVGGVEDGMAAMAARPGTGVAWMAHSMMHCGSLSMYDTPAAGLGGMGGTGGMRVMGDAGGACVASAPGGRGAAPSAPCGAEAGKEKSKDTNDMFAGLGDVLAFKKKALAAGSVRGGSRDTGMPSGGGGCSGAADPFGW